MRTRTKNSIIVYAGISLMGCLVLGLTQYNKIKKDLNLVGYKVEYRFKSYDFMYFSKYNYVIPNNKRTSGRLCVDTSHKEVFYVGDRTPTPFYDFMEVLNCNKKEVKRHANKSA